MSEEHLPGLSSWGQLGELPKRRRTPSQYATHIADFKNNLSLTARRPRSIRFADSVDVPEDRGRLAPSKPLLCTLPCGRTYNLTIPMPTRPPPAPKSERRRLRRAESVASNAPKVKEEAASVCLLDKFLNAFQNLQKEEEVDSKSNNEASKQNHSAKLLKREEKAPREREEKWNKYYERYRTLAARLERLQETYIFLI